METEPVRRGPKKVRSVHPIKRGWWFRRAHAGDADDSGRIHIEQNGLPIHASKPTSNLEKADLDESGKKTARWGDEIINIENY